MSAAKTILFRFVLWKIEFFYDGAVCGIFVQFPHNTIDIPYLTILSVKHLIVNCFYSFSLSQDKSVIFPVRILKIFADALTCISKSFMRS